jgi:hypothetical protein
MLLMATAAGACLAAVPPLARAETPAERASRMLNREVAGDRARDAAETALGRDTARSDPAPLPNAAAQQLDEDRATVRPDVGRPEEVGRASGTLRSTGEDRNVTR